jgi:hypothetical protein
LVIVSPTGAGLVPASSARLADAVANNTMTAAPVSNVARFIAVIP